MLTDSWPLILSNFQTKSYSGNFSNIESKSRIKKKGFRIRFRAFWDTT